jgi:hypothetical protein
MATPSASLTRHEAVVHQARTRRVLHLDFFDTGEVSELPGYNWQHEEAADEFAANAIRIPESLPLSVARRRDEAARRDVRH